MATFSINNHLSGELKTNTKPCPRSLVPPLFHLLSETFCPSSFSWSPLTSCVAVSPFKSLCFRLMNFLYGSYICKLICYYLVKLFCTFLFPVCLPVYLLVSLSTCLHLPVCLSFCLPICQHIYAPTHQCPCMFLPTLYAST